MYAIFILRQMMDKDLAKKNKLYLAFVDFEKAFYRVPRQGMRWAMRKSCVWGVAGTGSDGRKNLVEWRTSLLVKGLKANAWKTKLMASGGGGGVLSQLGAWPCEGGECSIHMQEVSGIDTTIGDGRRRHGGGWREVGHFRWFLLSGQHVEH